MSETLGKRLLAKLKPERSGCLIWTGQLDRGGYGVVRVGGRMRRVHVVMWLASGRPLGIGQVVRHRCDTPACSRLEHLVAGTQLDNVRDMDERGRRVNAQLRGDRHGQAKLTTNAVRYARLAYATGTSIAELARRFRVSHRTMTEALRGLTWKHVPPP